MQYRIDNKFILNLANANVVQIRSLNAGRGKMYPPKANVPLEYLFRSCFLVLFLLIAYSLRERVYKIVKEKTIRLVWSCCCSYVTPLPFLPSSLMPCFTSVSLLLRPPPQNPNWRACFFSSGVSSGFSVKGSVACFGRD